MVKSFNSTWDNETAYIGVGGSIPFANDFVREFPNAELVLIGAADEELGNAHAPNESVQIDHIEMLIESLVKTLKIFNLYLHKFNKFRHKHSKSFVELSCNLRKLNYINN